MGIRIVMHRTKLLGAEYLENGRFPPVLDATSSLPTAISGERTEVVIEGSVFLHKITMCLTSLIDLLWLLALIARALRIDGGKTLSATAALGRSRGRIFALLGSLHKPESKKELVGLIDGARERRILRDARFNRAQTLGSAVAEIRRNTRLSSSNRHAIQFEAPTRVFRGQRRC